MGVWAESNYNTACVHEHPTFVALSRLASFTKNTSLLLFVPWITRSRLYLHPAWIAELQCPVILLIQYLILDQFIKNDPDFRSHQPKQLYVPLFLFQKSLLPTLNSHWMRLFGSAISVAKLLRPKTSWTEQRRCSVSICQVLTSSVQMHAYIYCEDIWLVS